MRHLVCLAAPCLIVFAFPSRGNCQPAPMPDKHNFLLRAIAYQQRQIFSNPQNLEFAKLLAITRENLESIIAVGDNVGVDPDVKSIAKDLVRFTQQYEQFLVLCDLINSEAVKKAAEGITLRERIEYAGGKAARKALEKAADKAIGALLSGNEIEVEALLIYGGTVFTVEFVINVIDTGDLWERKKAGIIKERKDQILKARDSMVSTISADIARFRAVIGDLTRKYRWAPADGGVDASDEETNIYNTSIFSPKGEILDNVLSSHIQVLDAWKRLRPRDPFAIIEYSRYVGIRELRSKPTSSKKIKESADQFGALAENCRAAGKLVPSGAAFDPFVFDMIGTGVDFTHKARCRLNESFGASKPETSKYSLIEAAMWNDAINRCGDTTGYFRMKKAFALAYGGEWTEGFKLASEVAPLRKSEKCKTFPIAYARLLVRNRDEKSAMEWLEIAGACGANLNGLEADFYLGSIYTVYKSRMTPR